MPADSRDMVLVPREPTEAMLHAADMKAMFVRGESDLPRALWDAMLSASPARGEGDAPVAWPEKWSGPCTVGNMIANLSTIPPETPIYTGYHIHLEDQPSLLKVRRPTLSRERVDGTNIKTGDESIPYSAVIWAAPRDPADDRPTPATPEGLREALEALDEAVSVIRAINHELAGMAHSNGRSMRAENIARAFLAALQPHAEGE